jgi:hypothetical protein
VGPAMSGLAKPLAMLLGLVLSSLAAGLLFDAPTWAIYLSGMVGAMFTASFVDES